MAAVLQDARYGLRTLIRTPGFTFTAAVVLAFGIGVNATVFTLTNAFFLRPLPVTDPDGIVRVYQNRFSNVRYPVYVELRDRNSTLSSLTAFQLQSFGLRIDADTEHAFGEVVTGNYFQVLGVQAARGRLLEPADDRAGAPPAIVLSHAFWTRRFGGSPDAVGRIIQVSGQPFTIVGVAPSGFTGVIGLLAGDLWVPLSTDALLRPALDQNARVSTASFHLMGRLKPGADRARAQADLDTIGRQLRQAAGDPDRGPAVTVYGSTMLPAEISQPVVAFTAVLTTVAALILLIVCVNVANLVLARAVGRHAELAVRQSLGAGRGRLVRQLLTENLLLSIAGAAGGLAIAYWCAHLVRAARVPTPVPVLLNLSPDIRVFAFTSVVAILATLAFGIAPALTASRIDLVSALKGMSSERRGHGRLRSALLVAQVSMSVLLLIVAGLFIRGFRNARSIDPGFDVNGVMTASVDLETRGYSEAHGRDFIRLLSDGLDRAPGVISSNIVDLIPITLSNTSGYLLRSSDAEPPRGEAPATPQIYMNAVAPGHFRTLKIALLEGRDFAGLDGDSAPPVAIVNQTLAERFWPGQSAVGQRVRPIGSTNPREVIEVIGVVRNCKYVSIGEDPRPFLYRPLAQMYTPRLTMLVRSSGSPASTLSTITDEVRKIDPALAVFNAATLAEATAISLLPARAAGMLLGALGVLALVLAALGTYGVLSYLVRSRTREIGIRVAIGAQPAAVALLIARQAMTWTIIGATLGVALALGLTRFTQSFLYGVSPTDPLTFIVVTGLLAMVAAIAALFPAWRASRIDPLVALRSL